jgi:hypothetical protein
MPLLIGRAAKLARLGAARNLAPRRTRPIARGVIYEASFSGFLHSFEIVVICILLTLAEFVAVALLVAPRAVARKLLSPMRALLWRARRILVARSPRREPARPSRRGM